MTETLVSMFHPRRCMHLPERRRSRCHFNHDPHTIEVVHLQTLPAKHILLGSATVQQHLLYQNRSLGDCTFFSPRFSLMAIFTASCHLQYKSLQQCVLQSYGWTEWTGGTKISLTLFRVSYHSPLCLSTMHFLHDNLPCPKR